MISNKNPVIISGASITNDSAWPTWATWVKKRYEFKNVVDVSVKGLGNEAIILKAVYTALKFSNPLILVQLTNVDKWDWYVDDLTLIESINKEKHPITPIADFDSSGFWSTGSHFPVWKEYYKNNYYSLQYHVHKTLQQIQWLQLLTAKHKWTTIILFDSPVLSVIEDQIITGNLTKDQCIGNKLIDSTISKIIFDDIDFSDIYVPGLIGYACLNGMQWYSDRYKAHPGSLTHYYYAKDIVCSKLDTLVEPINQFESFLNEAEKFQRLIEQ